jgi:hypothetical protein
MTTFTPNQLKAYVGNHTNHAISANHATGETYRVAATCLARKSGWTECRHHFPSARGSRNGFVEGLAGIG